MLYGYVSLTFDKEHLEPSRCAFAIFWSRVQSEEVLLDFRYF